MKHQTFLHQNLVIISFFVFQSVQDSSRSMDDDEVFDVKAANKLTLLVSSFRFQL